MADNSFKINKSANFNPQPGLPANPLNGDFYFDGNIGSFIHYHGGFWSTFDSITTVTATDPMTSAQFTPAVVMHSTVKIVGGTTPTHLNGIAASFTGKRLTVYNAGTSYITIEYNDSSEPTANNRILTPTGGDMNLIAGEIAQFVYDLAQNRWLLVSISSQAGAQLIATTTSPGIVTLHQASLHPLDGIVLSDGDLNTATGVVGLDANRAAFIAAPLTSVTAFTVTAASNASAIVVNGATGATAMTIAAAGTGNLGLQVDGVNGATALVAYGHGASGQGAAFYGSGTGPGATLQGGASSVAGQAISVGNYAAFAAAGYLGTALFDPHTTNGLVAITAVAGAGGGDGIVTYGAGTGYAGIHAYGGVGGYGIVANAGSGGIYAGIFNGDINVTGGGNVSSTLTVGALGVTAGGGITTADGFTVASSTANISTTGGLSVQGFSIVDGSGAFNGTWTTTSKSLHFGGTSSEGIGSKRTSGGNQNGLDFYTNSLSRMSITNAGDVSMTGNLTVSGSLTVSSGTITVFDLTVNDNEHILGLLTVDQTIRSVKDIIVDSSNVFDGAFSSGFPDNLLRFGSVSSGEAIGSKRTSGGNQFGLDFFTQYISRMTIDNSGNVNVVGSFTAGTVNSNGNINASSGTVNAASHYSTGGMTLRTTLSWDYVGSGGASYTTGAGGSNDITSYTFTPQGLHFDFGYDFYDDGPTSGGTNQSKVFYLFTRDFGSTHYTFTFRIFDLMGSWYDMKTRQSG